MTTFSRLLALLCCAHSLLTAAPTTRAKDFTEALALAQESGNDIAVFQRGSDWNLLGERLHQSLWLSPDLEKNLGDGFVLTSVDHPERPGAPALGSGEDPSAIQRFHLATTPGTPLPKDEITSVRSESDTSFKQRPDGTWLLSQPADAPNPAQDTLTLNLRSPRGGQLLRIDFLPDPTLPNAAAGRASNGNFALSEIELSHNGKPLAASHIWASAHEANMTATQLIDGILDQGNNGWNPAAHTRQPRTLLIALASPLRPAATLQIRLICRSQWPQHIPACFRAAVIDDAPLTQALQRVTAAETLASRNATFTWWNTNLCPRIALLDSEGRAIAAIDTPRSDLTPQSLAQAISKLRETRIARDELLAKAEKAQGIEKAELLRQSLATLGFANWTGNADCYKPVHDLIRQLDPQDQSGTIRWLGFSSDPKGGVPWTKPSWDEALDTQNGTKTLTDADYQEALSRVDKELADPRNRILSTENIQRIMVAKYHIYKRWPGKEDERFRIQQEIADLDPETFWGIGSRGYIGMHCKSPTPYLTYGWKPNQLIEGTNHWIITDTAYYFDHPGHYKLTLTHTAGTSSIKIKRLALMHGETPIAQSSPDALLGPGQNARVETLLDASSWKPNTPYTLLAEIETTPGQTDNAGSFSVEPELIEPPVVSAPATPTPDWFRTRRDLREKLSPILLAARDQLAKPLASPTVQLDLARHELLRRCGTDAIQEIANRPGGSTFLTAFTTDLPWLESFLANDDCKWPQALENLRLIHNHHSPFPSPLHRTLATAISMAAGDMNRYRLLDRYNDILLTHREGLLHPSFDHLDVREMRWAIPLAGTSPDYRFTVDTMQCRHNDYLGACWGIPYIDPNVYGYSVQGWGYTDPWTHHHGTGTGDRPFRVQRTVGGVCGTLSGFGATVARAHGVMSTTVGQPGHCAYVVRVGQEWPTGNDVSGPETNGASVYEGTGFPTMHRLYEPIHADKPAFLLSSRLSWAAHLLIDRRAATVRILPGLQYSVHPLPAGNLDEFSKHPPLTTGIATTIDLPSLTPPDPTNFGITWQGQIEILGDGPLMVEVKSDDASRLTIAGQIIPTNQGPQPVSIRQGTHPIKLEYGQAGGALSLSLNWSSPVPWDADWTGAYQQAIAAQPIHYPLLLETIKTFEATPDLPPATWRKLIGEIATAYAPYHEAAWALINRCYQSASPALTPQQRMELLLQCHQRIRQEDAPAYFGYNIPHVLNLQADSLQDPQLAVSFMQKLMTIHYSTDPAKCRVFGSILNWGRDRFAANATTATAYAKAIGTFFAAQSKTLGTSAMQEQISAGIRKAAESNDITSWRLWTDMAIRFLPPPTPAEVHLNPEQAAAWPKFQHPSTPLLSKDGILTLSSACQFDRPLSHRAVIDGTAPGWFDTNPEPKPWAQVYLAGDAEISTIIAINRYEYPSDHEEFQWAAPFKILISTDGTTWTEAATCQKAEAVMRIDLPTPQRARYVRIQNQPPTDPSKPPGRLHLRNFLIYGRKLY